MITKELSEAAVEINTIFENMAISLLDKIPENFRNFFIEIASENYKFEYNKLLSLKEQKLLPETKGILAIIYRDYLCNDVEKECYNKEYNRVLFLKEQEKYQVYSPNNLFKNKMDKDTHYDISVLPVEYKKVSLFRKIVEKFKKIFKK